MALKCQSRCRGGDFAHLDGVRQRHEVAALDLGPNPKAFDKPSHSRNVWRREPQNGFEQGRPWRRANKEVCGRCRVTPVVDEDRRLMECLPCGSR